MILWIIKKFLFFLLTIFKCSNFYVNKFTNFNTLHIMNIIVYNITGKSYFWFYYFYNKARL